MTLKHGLLGLFLPIIVGAIIVSYGGFSKWMLFAEEHTLPKYEQIREVFGEPEKDIGSGVHIDIYPQKIGHARVGHTGSGPVLYIDYCVFLCKRLYEKKI